MCNCTRSVHLQQPPPQVPEPSSSPLSRPSHVKSSFTSTSYGRQCSNPNFLLLVYFPRNSTSSILFPHDPYLTTPFQFAEAMSSVLTNFRSFKPHLVHKPTPNPFFSFILAHHLCHAARNGSVFNRHLSTSLTRLPQPPVPHSHTLHTPAVPTNSHPPLLPPLLHLPSLVSSTHSPISTPPQRIHQPFLHPPVQVSKLNRNPPFINQAFTSSLSKEKKNKSPSPPSLSLYPQLFNHQKYLPPRGSNIPNLLYIFQPSDPSSSRVHSSS